MSVTKEAFKQTMSCWASGITVVTIKHEDGLLAMTASSFTSLSAEPPLILVAVNKNARIHSKIAEQKAFGVMILSSTQEEISNGGAGFRGPEGSFLPGISFRQEITGAPILDDCLAWMDCSLDASYEAGDHTIYVGKLEATGSFQGEPLLWYSRGYRKLT
ncbi:MAG: flavin reductase family protein [Acidobacteria bacterium]|nr:flavin reductase family protein [Acidobacteriota bacterium]